MSSNSNSKVEETVGKVNSLNKWLLALFVALLVFLLFQIIFVFNALQNAPVTKTILDYPIQKVQSTVEGIEGPAVRLSSDSLKNTSISVLAEKCNESSDIIVVETRVSWDTLDPRGTVIEDWNGVQEVASGCETYTYSNPIPRLVRERTLQLIDDFSTLECIQWRLIGLDAPVNPEFTPERWATEAFCVYPPESEN